MRQILISLTTFFGLTASLLLSCGEAPSNKEVNNTLDTASLVKRGEYLVSIAGCDDCHSPKQMGAMGPELVPGLRLSGYPADRPTMPLSTDALSKGWVLLAPDLTSASGPWGTSFAANITGDASGIGNWTEAQFFTALRKGKFKGLETGRNLLPPMPIASTSKFTDEDLRSIFFYLKSLPPVKNTAPVPLPPTATP